MSRQLFHRCSALFHGQAGTIIQRHIQPAFKQPCANVIVWEKDKKGGYRKERKETNIQMIKEGVKMIKPEFYKFCYEMKEKFAADLLMDIRHGDYEYVWKFHDRNSVENWVVTADRDNSEGKSEANFILSKNNTGLFHGYLCQEVPKDGIVKRTGYCNIRSPTKFVSLHLHILPNKTLFK